MSLRVFKQFFSQQRLAGGAFVLAITQFLASLAGLFRDRILASTFPPGLDPLDTVSVYIAAFRPSDLLFQILVMSAFSVALVPLLAGHLARAEKDEMDRLMTSTLLLAGVLFGIVSLLLAIFFRNLAPLFVAFEGPRLELYIHFGRLACFTNFLFVTGNAFGQYLIARQVYWAYGIAPIIYTLGTIGGTIFLTPVFGVYGPMYGTVLGALFYLWVRYGSALLQGFSFRVSHLLHPEIREMGWLMLPRMVALGALQLQLLLFDRVASALPAGSITINAFARNFQAAGVGVIGIALAQSAFSPLSQAIARGDLDRFHGYLRKGSLLTLALTIPAAIALASLGNVAAWLVHLRSGEVVATFIVALGLYAMSIPLESLNHLLLRAIYATKHTTVPAIATTQSGGVAIAVAWIFATTYGVYALAAGFLAGQLLELVFLALFLRVRVRTLAPALSPTLEVVPEEL